MDLALVVIVSILSVVGIIIALLLFMMNHFMDDQFSNRDWEGERHHKAARRREKKKQSHR